MQDGMKMGSAKSGYQGRDRSGMQGNGEYGGVRSIEDAGVSNMGTMR